MNTIEAPKQGGRLLSLDILRGITIAGMIMVNNPGSWSSIYTPLGHAMAWSDTNRPGISVLHVYNGSFHIYVVAQV